jgi:hypothetical protein
VATFAAIEDEARLLIGRTLEAPVDAFDVSVQRKS